MCSPTLAISGISQAFKFVQARKEQRAIREQAIKQREIAEKNYRLKVAQEQLKIRQQEEAAVDKITQAKIEGKQLKAKLKYMFPMTNQKLHLLMLQELTKLRTN